MRVLKLRTVENGMIYLVAYARLVIDRSIGFGLSIKLKLVYGSCGSISKVLVTCRELRGRRRNEILGLAV